MYKMSVPVNNKSLVQNLCHEHILFIRQKVCNIYKAIPHLVIICYGYIYIHRRMSLHR